MPTKPRLRATPATLGSLAAVVALAMVGVIALSGSQARASHVSCGDTITADTTLDSDLVDCPSNGIVIGADDITLDLNGHTVGGDGTEFAGCPENEFCDIGLLNDGHDGVKLRDGSVRQFAFGVLVVGSRHNRVADITVSRNAGTGIILFKSSRNTVIGNSARANGLQLDQGGISLNRSHHNVIKGNSLRGNGDLGVFMEISDNNRIRKNRMLGHPEGGVIAEGHGNVFSRNRIVRGGGGILITKLTGHGAVGNVVRRNYVRGARGSGISVDTAPKRTVLSRNHVRGSGSDGFKVGSKSTKLTKNRAVHNSDLGIDAVKGVIDGGGNRARGNGDSRQCVNVTCH
jgi:parallel beta-helix repeat protein